MYNGILAIGYHDFKAWMPHHMLDTFRYYDTRRLCIIYYIMHNTTTLICIVLLEYEYSGNIITSISSRVLCILGVEYKLSMQHSFFFQVRTCGCGGHEDTDFSQRA